MSPGRADAGWIEVVYLLVARYRMPDPAEIAGQFLEHRREHGEAPPAVALIRDNLDVDESDLCAISGGAAGDAEIRAYLREILRRYDLAEAPGER